MTVRQLIEKLQQMERVDGWLMDARVTFTPEDGEMQFIEGGIVAKDQKTNLVVLNLAPISLQGVGGF